MAKFAVGARLRICNETHETIAGHHAADVTQWVGLLVDVIEVNDAHNGDTRVRLADLSRPRPDGYPAAESFWWPDAWLVEPPPPDLTDPRKVEEWLNQ